MLMLNPLGSIHFFFLDPSRFGRLAILFPASSGRTSDVESSAGRFFSAAAVAALASAFAFSLAISSVSLFLMSLLSAYEAC